VTRAIVGAVALGVAAHAVLAPVHARAQVSHKRHDRPSESGSAAGGVTQGFPQSPRPIQAPAPFVPAPPAGQPSPGRPSAPPGTAHFHRPVPPGGAGVVSATPPVLYYGAPGYDYAYPPVSAPTVDSPVVYAAPPVPALPTDSDAVTRVIEYPTGRYELRGDGMTTPYAWVWVPNPPPAPPTAGVDRPEPAAERVAAPAARSIYRWRDGEGVVHFTDSVDAVPVEYRPQTHRLGGGQPTP
jgi:hypothetical protein